MTRSERIERGALAAHWFEFHSEPSEPLRTRGGVFDPGGWTWRIAEAVADGTEPPRICSDRPVAPECLWAIEAAMDLR